MKKYINQLKEKDQKMEDSALQKHMVLDEQFTIKNKELITQSKKERKKKELDEKFDRERLEKVTLLIRLLKKGYKDLVVHYTDENNQAATKKIIELLEYEFKSVSDEELKNLNAEVILQETNKYNKKRDLAHEKVTIIGDLIKTKSDGLYNTILENKQKEKDEYKAYVMSKYNEIMEKKEAVVQRKDDLDAH
mmetsp:Transcript_95604/g.206274  ORF Transcript_95604/g.206274 Transcript_95604/m.206274 type:complete len:192 (-) Transcript_95604:658-1233(-)